MERYAWTARILDGKKEEYVRRHDEIWPEMKEVLHEAGITNQQNEFSLAEAVYQKLSGKKFIGLME